MEGLEKAARPMTTRFPTFSVLSTLLVGALALAPACTTDDSVTGDGAGNPNEDGGDDGDSTSFNPADGGEGPGNSDTNGNGNGSGMMDAEDDAMMDEGPDGDEAGFIEPPDGGVTGQCDPAAQDCPEGEKCTSFVSMPGGQTVDATKCVPATGAGLAGEPCVREAENDDCDAGFFCMTEVSGNTGDGFCLEYCDIGTMVCEFGGECFAFNDGALPICQVTCDPLLQDCVPGQGCYAAFDNFVCAVPGHADGSGNDGDACATVQSCQPGLLCRTGTNGCEDGAGCCTPVCAQSNGGTECTDGAEECVPALDNPPPGFDDVGYCGVPA